MRPVAILLLVLLFGQPASAQKPAEVEKAIFVAANAYREKHDAGKLTRDATLDGIAQKHAQAMAKLDRYGDDNKNGHILDGKGPSDRARAGGYAFAYLAENVGWNIRSTGPAERIMKDWIASPPHRKNLVGRTVTQTGIGAAQGKSGRWYFVQMFGRPLSQITSIKVAIENRTRRVIKFAIGPTKYELKPSQKGVYTSYRAEGKIQVRISWPGVETAQTSDLADKTHYAFAEKKKGGFEFVKVGAL